MLHVAQLQCHYAHVYPLACHGVCWPFELPWRESSLRHRMIGMNSVDVVVVDQMELLMFLMLLMVMVLDGVCWLWEELRYLELPNRLIVRLGIYGGFKGM